MLSRARAQVCACCLPPSCRHLEPHGRKALGIWALIQNNPLSSHVDLSWTFLSLRFCTFIQLLYFPYAFPFRRGARIRPLASYLVYSMCLINVHHRCHLFLVTTAVLSLWLCPGHIASLLCLGSLPLACVGSCRVSFGQVHDAGRQGRVGSQGGPTSIL